MILVIELIFEENKINVLKKELYPRKHSITFLINKI